MLIATSNTCASSMGFSNLFFWSRGSSPVMRWRRGLVDRSTRHAFSRVQRRVIRCAPAGCGFVERVDVKSQFTRGISAARRRHILKQLADSRFMNSATDFSLCFRASVFRALHYDTASPRSGETLDFDRLKETGAESRRVPIGCSGRAALRELRRTINHANSRA